MIKSFRDKTTELVFYRKPARGFPSNLFPATVRRLDALDTAKSLEQLAAVPGNRLHPLHGNRAGQHSISINMQWRICFEWRDGDAWSVEITDYH
jgi:proteic killer suppression protein